MMLLVVGMICIHRNALELHYIFKNGNVVCCIFYDYFFFYFFLLRMFLKKIIFKKYFIGINYITNKKDEKST